MTLDPKQLLRPTNVQDPYAFYDAVRAEAPVWEVGGSGVFIVTAFAALADAARRIKDFSSNMIGLLYRDGEGLPALLRMSFGDPTLANADPPAHTQQKQMIFPRFVGRRMALIEDYLAAFTAQRIEHVRGLSSFDFMDEIGSAVPIRAISHLIGFRDMRDDMLRDIAFGSVEMTSATKSLEEMGRVQLRMAEIQEWMDAQLAERSGNASEDILDAVRGAMDDGRMTPVEALVTMVTLLAAGGESTSSLLGNAVRMLAERAELRERIQADRTLLPAFIEEAARLESPFQHHLRSTPHDTELAGVAIPAGSAVMLMWGAANRDPAKFDDPSAFTFGRSLQHVVFGRGIHQCVGSSLARMEARIVLDALLALDLFPSLAPDEEPEYEYSLQVRRHRRLRMVWN